jgi:hypothetical protein
LQERTLGKENSRYAKSNVTNRSLPRVRVAINQTPTLTPTQTMPLENCKSTESIPEVAFLDKSFDSDVEPDFGPSEFKMMELEGRLSEEPLLAADKTRFVLFPIKQPDVSNHEVPPPYPVPP